MRVLRSWLPLLELILPITHKTYSVEGGEAVDEVAGEVGVAAEEEREWKLIKTF